jgi:hypothetical protein
MLYVLDRDGQWWRATEFYRGSDGVRLDKPEVFADVGRGREWRHYAPGGLIFEGAASDVWIPREFIKRIVT